MGLPNAGHNYTITVWHKNFTFYNFTVGDRTVKQNPLTLFY